MCIWYTFRIFCLICSYMYRFHPTCLHICIYIYVCTCICIRICMHTYMHTCIHACVCMCIYVYRCVYVVCDAYSVCAVLPCFVCLIFTYIPLFNYADIYTCTYIYTSLNSIIGFCISMSTSIPLSMSIGIYSQIRTHDSLSVYVFISSDEVCSYVVQKASPFHPTSGTSKTRFCGPPCLLDVWVLFVSCCQHLISPRDMDHSQGPEQGPYVWSLYRNLCSSLLRSSVPCIAGNLAHVRVTWQQVAPFRSWSDNSLKGSTYPDLGLSFAFKLGTLTLTLVES